MAVPGSFTGTTWKRTRPCGIPARATHKFRSFFWASKEGGYEAVRTVLEEPGRKSLPSSFLLHVTLGQTAITTTKNFSIDSLLTENRGTRRAKGWSAEFSSPTFLGFLCWVPLLTRQVYYRIMSSRYVSLRLD